ncbi:MAG TPA: CehA/McbA family metallohydrolase, partial [Acidobacteriota bacterium]|nr:CehA/McbA family metallohydrolase [Acidobacteriota bacterium]
PTLMLLALIGFLEIGEAQSEADSGINEFVSTLVRDHIYLFEAEDRQVLAEMNRSLQEYDWVTRRTRDRNRQAEIQRRQTELIERTRPLLERLPHLRDVSLAGPEPRLSPDIPINLPGDAGAVLLRVDNGQGEPNYTTVVSDMSLSGARRPVAIRLRGTGPNWVLLSLSNVPTGRSTIMVTCEDPDGRRSMIPVVVATPSFGRLKVRILSDDTGQPCPAMVRLIWKTDGRDRKPPNAVDLAPQFDNLGNATSQRPANLPGEVLRSFWWLVPGPFDMSVPPGDWEITIRRGVEHRPVTETFTVAEGQNIEKTYRPRRWVDMRKHGWYSGDDHVHGRILSDADAHNLMMWVQAEDIHVANVVKMGDIARTYFEQRGFGPDYRVRAQDYILAPGQECPRTHNQLGHTLSMNIRSMVRDTDKYFLYDWVFDQVQEQGGLSGYAHVLSDSFYVHRDMTLNVPKGKVDFAELMQFGRLGTELYNEFLNLGFKITASAGSDVPWGGTVGEVRLYAYVGEQKQFSPDAWFQAVGRGRTFVTNGPMIDFRVDDVFPGDELKVSRSRKLKVRARAWGDKDFMTPTRLEIIRLGEVIKSIEPSREGQEELRLDFEVDSEYGFWISARAVGSNQSEAFTTPVYVVRDPFRFWKIEDVDELIEKRLKSLDEIEQFVEQARNPNAEPEGDEIEALSRMLLVKQADALLERVNAARKTYEGLRQIAKQEREAGRAVELVGSD